MSDPTFYTPLGGTHDWKRGIWYECDSPFAVWMKSEGLICYRRQGPFWSGMLGGVPFLKHKAWDMGASLLQEWVEEHIAKIEERNIITLSHGGQPAMKACANGLKVRSLTTITMPQRADMEETYRAAIKNIGDGQGGGYTNVFSDSWWRDRWQIYGSLRFTRQMHLDGLDLTNIGIPGVGHSELVRTNKMVLLRKFGVLDRVRAA